MLARLKLSGSAHDIGFGLGEFGRDAVHAKLRPLPLWQWLASQANTEKAQRMQVLVRQHFPRYWQELEGLAAGLQLPLAEVFLWNCRGDFPGLPAVDGCTTVYGRTARGTLIAHNEDGLPPLRGDCALVEVRPDEGVAFTSFAYPGSIPGHTFAVNAFGVVATVNNLRPTDIPTGVPRQILGRASLDARSIDEAIAAVSFLPRAGAFHHTFGQAGSARVVSVEASATATAVVEIERPGGHANHIVHAALAGVGQRITDSSDARQRQVEVRLAAHQDELSPTQALDILRDTAVPDLPIYRCAADDPDDENTLASAVFILTPTGVEWSVHTGAAQETPAASGVVSVSA
ncbi:C45 family autoproteolytic acyltransferase/hydolase [Pseudomonas oryzihabitans]|uniref:C45 family autoproteolytic acyltransferase/hydolase n=1 Tax=Pseudomonas oryzihabitans TaxID=47885 RepID=UPI0011205A28|nr:C45 family peptidase [Pseudomonas psychrotolerans]QDD89711.1 acyl-CoA--6-aminopenicillanic acid acyl-transferase [Pseudomonas psychrotolerans]